MKNTYLFWFILVILVSPNLANDSSVVPECVSNDDCETDRVCARQKCVNPCAAVCGPNTTCVISNHVAMCSCALGYSGHPYIGCSPSPITVTCPQTPPKKKKFYVEISKKADWQGALMDCLRHNASLASIESLDELELVRNLIRLEVRGRNSFWLSGSDHDREGNFIWVSTGKPLLWSSSLWLPGQPDNGRRHDEHCVELWDPSHHGGYGLNDEDCKKKAFFVCEYYN